MKLTPAGRAVVQRTFASTVLTLCICGCPARGPARGDHAAGDGGGGLSTKVVTPVGRGGGVVEMDGVRLTIPQGALTFDLSIAVSRLPSPPCQPAFQFEPSGLVFAHPADLALETDPACSAEPIRTQAVGTRINKQWRELPTTKSENVIHANVSHFSDYGVMTIDAAPAFAEGVTAISHHRVTVSLDPGVLADLTLQATDDVIMLVAHAPTALGSRVLFDSLDSTGTWFWYVNGHDSHGAGVATGGVLAVNLPPAVTNAAITVQRAPGTRIVQNPEDCNPCALAGGAVPGCTGADGGATGLPGTLLADGTCLLADDVLDSVVIKAPGVKLDCNGHSVVFSGDAGALGVDLQGDGTGLQNCTVTGFATALKVSGSNVGARNSTMHGHVSFLAGVNGSISDVNMEALQDGGRPADLTVAAAHTTVQGNAISGRLIVTGLGACSILSNTVSSGAVFSVPTRSVGAHDVSGNTFRAIALQGPPLAVIYEVPSLAQSNLPVIHHNNIDVSARAAGLYVEGALAPVTPLDLSASDDSGNFWGHTRSPFFRPSDVNTPVLTDSHPYCVANGWDLGFAPGQCPSVVTPPSPAVDAPPYGSVQGIPVATIRGTAPGASRVSVWVDAQKVGDALVTGGAFAVDLTPPLGAGKHHLTVYATAVGTGGVEKVSAPTGHSFAVVLPPLLAPVMAFPLDGDEITGGRVPVVGTAEPLTIVLVQLDANPTVETSVNPSGTWAVELPGVGAGAHTITVTPAFGTTTGPSTAVTFQATDPPSTGSPATDATGRISVALVSQGGAVLYTADEDTSENVYAVSTKNLSPRICVKGHLSGHEGEDHADDHGFGHHHCHWDNGNDWEWESWRWRNQHGHHHVDAGPPPPPPPPPSAELVECPTDREDLDGPTQRSDFNADWMRSTTNSRVWHGEARVPGIPVTVVTELLLAGSTEYRTLAKAFPQALVAGQAHPDQLSTVSLLFDGYNNDSVVEPPWPKALTRVVQVEMGWLSAVNVADLCRPAGPEFNNISAQAGLFYCSSPVRTVPATGGAIGMATDSTGDTFNFRPPCRTIFSDQITPANLGPISRAVPPIRMCCSADFRATTLAAVVTTVSNTRLTHFATPGMCETVGGGSPPLCGHGGPRSPWGEVCLKQIGTRVDQHKNRFGLCELEGLELLPPSNNGSAFDARRVLAEGPATIDVVVATPRATDAETLATLQRARFHAELGPNPTAGLDDDGDGLPNRFDSCPIDVEALDPAPDGTCGPGSPPEKKCLRRGAPDSDGDCIQDICDCPGCAGRFCSYDAECASDRCSTTGRCGPLGRCVYEDVVPPSPFCAPNAQDPQGPNVPWTWMCTDAPDGVQWSCNAVRSLTCEGAASCVVGRCVDGYATCQYSMREDGTACKEQELTATCNGTVLSQPVCSHGLCTNNPALAIQRDCTQEPVPAGLDPQCAVRSCAAVDGGAECVAVPKPTGTVCTGCPLDQSGNPLPCNLCEDVGHCDSNAHCVLGGVACPSGACNPFTGECQ